MVIHSTVWTNGRGRFDSTWYVNPDDSGGAVFLLTALGGTSGLAAEWVFTDNPAVNLDQCRNGESTTPNDCFDFGASQGSFGWVNGNAGPEHSHYAEGHSIPYRARMTELPVGGTVVIELGYDIKHGGKHALDFLTHYQRLLPHGGFGHTPEVVTPFDILGNGVQGVSSTFSEHPIPVPVPDFHGSPVAGQPAARFNSLPAGERVMTLWGGTIEDIQYGTNGDLTAAQSETTILITFTPTSDANGNGAKTTTAVLAWGGHIARTADWGAGAGTISGSPYHMRIKDWTGDPSLGNLGNQDRSLKVEAVFPAGKVTIVKNTEGADGTFDFSSTGGGGLPADFSITTTDGTGSITFSQVLTGAKTVTEGALANGWEFRNLVCEEAGIGLGVPDNGTTTDGFNTALIDMDGAEHITCTFVNKATGKITLIKNVDNTGGGTKEVKDFPLFVGDDLVHSGIATNPTPGTYTIREDNLFGLDYTASDWSCVGTGFTQDGSGEIVDITIDVGADVTCTITNTFQPNPLMTVEKTSTTTSLSAPGTVTYDYVVTNDGNVTLTGVSLADDNDNDDASCVATTIPVGGSTTCTATHTFTQAELDANGSPVAASGVLFNTVTASSNEAPDAGDDLSIPIVRNPVMTVEKTSVTTSLSAPGTVTYEYVVTNDGNVTLTGVSLADDNDNDDASCVATTIPVGGSTTCTATHTFTQAELDANGSPVAASGVLFNTVTASSNEAPDTGDDLSIPIVRNPALSIVKTATPTTYDAAGNVISYSYLVTNTGNVTISQPITIDDDIATDEACPAVPASLAPGDTITCTASHTITQADLDAGSVTNVASASGFDPNGNAVTSPTDTETVTANQDPAILADKALTDNDDLDGSGDVSVGDTLTYTITATNTGNVTLSNVTVDDTLTGTVGAACAVSLAPGISCSVDVDYVVQQLDVDAGTIQNTGTVSGTPPVGPPVSDDDPEDVPVPSPSLVTVKELTDNDDLDGSGDVSVGDTLTYTITVTNNGTANLTNVTVEDSLTGASTSCALVIPGGTCVLTTTYVVLNTDVGTTIQNTGTGDSDQTPPDSEDEDVPVPSPSLVTVKELTDNDDLDGSGDVSVGDTLTYTITVTNNGTANLTNVSISNPLPGLSALNCTPAQPATLAPTETLDCTATYVVTAADVVAGSIANTATASSTQTPDDTDDETVPNPELSVDKPAPVNADEDGSGAASPGDTLTYTITATNTGTANLTNVVVTDSLITPTGGGTTPCALVLPGGTCTLVGTYVVQASDLGGDIVNTATASSDQTPDATDDETVPVPSGGVSMTKLTNGLPDETMTWKFTLTGPNGVNEMATTPPTSFDFGGVTLIPGLTYQVCETGIPAGWTAEWSVGATGIPFVAGVNTSPVGPNGYSDLFDPNYVALPETYSNDTRCVNFTVGADETLAFEIDNTFVGGGQRTIGYWKNWNLCSNGGQAATAAANGGAASGWFILDDLLADPGFLVGDLVLGGADCVEATRILNKSDIVSDEKKASDPAFNMAAQLLAAMLNEAAQANTCAASTAAVEDGQALLAGNPVNFDGTGEYLKSNGQARRANELAETLDLYNNGLLCQ